MSHTQLGPAGRGPGPSGLEERLSRNWLVRPASRRRSSGQRRAALPCWVRAERGSRARPGPSPAPPDPRDLPCAPRRFRGNGALRGKGRCAEITALCISVPFSLLLPRASLLPCSCYFPCCRPPSHGSAVPGAVGRAPSAATARELGHSC